MLCTCLGLGAPTRYFRTHAWPAHVSGLDAKVATGQAVSVVSGKRSVVRSARLSVLGLAASVVPLWTASVRLCILTGTASEGHAGAPGLSTSRTSRPVVPLR